MALATRSKAEEIKREQEQRRVLLTLCVRYIQSAGYQEAAQKVIHDSGISLEKFDLADNIDLSIILKDFEDYYFLRHNKQPKVIKKAEFVEEKKTNKSLSSKPKTTQPAKKDSQENKKEDLELSGKAINKPKEPEVETHDEYYENRLLKPLPDYPVEYKDLAVAIQRDICMANPGVYFREIIGLTECKRLLKEAVLMPMKYPHLFTGLLEPWKGILLFGPPGTGKTMLAKAVATECRTTFFNISASSIVSKWRGDSEKLIRVLFELAKYYEPSTIFIDEIDSIMSQRDAGEHEGSRRMKTELLIQMDGLVKNKEKIFLLAASNLPWDLDIALLRRLEKRILVPLPTKEAKKQMIESLIPSQKIPNIDTLSLANRLENYSGSDIRLLCKEASMKPIRRLMRQLENMDENMTMNWHVPAEPTSIPAPGGITVQDFEEALINTKPSSQIKQGAYEEWFSQYGSV